MGSFSRLRYVIAANLNSLLEKAEDPEKLLRALIREMEEPGEDARMAVAELLAEQQHLERRCAGFEQEMAEWQDRAEQAVEAERDDLARAALKARAELVERHRGPLHGYLVRMLASKDDAEDLFQEAFLRVVRHAERFDDPRRFRLDRGSVQAADPRPDGQPDSTGVGQSRGCPQIRPHIVTRTSRRAFIHDGLLSEASRGSHRSAASWWPPPSRSHRARPAV